MKSKIVLQNNKLRAKMKNLIFIILFIPLETLCFSQLSGPTPVLGGSTQMYTYSGAPVTNPYWRCTGGSVTSYNGYQSANITWNTTSTSGSVTLFSNYGSTLVQHLTFQFLILPQPMQLLILHRLLLLPTGVQLQVQPHTGSMFRSQVVSQALSQDTTTLL